MALKKTTSGGGGGHSFTVNTTPSKTQQVAEAQRVNEALRQAQAQSAQAQANAAKSAATSVISGAKSGANTGTKTVAGTSMGGNVPTPVAGAIAGAQAGANAVPDYLKNATVSTPLADAAYNARKAEQDAAAWQQQYDNIYGYDYGTNDSGNNGGGGGTPVTQAVEATRASSGGSSGGGGGSSLADLIGNVVVDPTAEIRQRYAGILQDLANNNQFALDKLKGNYDTSVNTINADFDVSQARQNQDAEDALRQAYINYMMSRKNMDSDMMRQGYNGGVSESNQARMYNNYGNIRNDIRKSLANAIEQLNLKRNASLGEALNQYNSQLADQTSEYFKQKQNYETALSNAIANLLK